ncbi:MAG: chemotaxis protein CheD [Brevundimonas sp.]
MRYDIRSRAWDHGGRPVSLTSISQGQYSISDDPDAVITTVLGSCVAACIRDPKRGVGGMNHFVLPEPPTPLSAQDDPSRYGSYLMQRLIDGLLEAGANPYRLEAMVFGGASPGGSFYNIGARNMAFAREFLADRGIAVVDSICGGRAGCKLEYWPASGKLVHTRLGKTEKPKPPRIKLRRVLPLAAA